MGIAPCVSILYNEIGIAIFVGNGDTEERATAQLKNEHYFIKHEIYTSNRCIRCSVQQHIGFWPKCS